MYCPNRGRAGGCCNELLYNGGGGVGVPDCVVVAFFHSRVPSSAHAVVNFLLFLSLPTFCLSRAQHLIFVFFVVVVKLPIAQPKKGGFSPTGALKSFVLQSGMDREVFFTFALIAAVVFLGWKDDIVPIPVVLSLSSCPPFFLG